MRWWPFGRSESSADAVPPAHGVDPEPERGEIHCAPPSDWRRAEPVPIAIRNDVSVVQRQSDGWLATSRDPSMLGKLGHLVDDHGPIGVIRPSVVDDPDPAPAAPEQHGEPEAPHQDRSRSWMPRSVPTVAPTAPSVQRSVVSAPTSSRGAPRLVPSVELPAAAEPGAAELGSPVPTSVDPALPETADVETRPTVGVDDPALAPTVDLAEDVDIVQRSTSSITSPSTTPPSTTRSGGERRDDEATEVRPITSPVQRSTSDAPPSLPAPSGGGDLDLPAGAPPAPDGVIVEQAAPGAEAPAPEERPLLGALEATRTELAETPGPQPPSSDLAGGAQRSVLDLDDASPAEPNEIRPTIASAQAPNVRPLGLGAPLVQRSSERAEPGATHSTRASSADAPLARDADPTPSPPAEAAPIQPALQRSIAEPLAPRPGDPVTSTHDDTASLAEVDRDQPPDPVEVGLVGERALTPVADSGGPLEHAAEAPSALSTPPIQRALDEDGSDSLAAVIEPPPLTPVSGGTTSWPAAQRSTPAPAVVRPIVSQQSTDEPIGSLPSLLGGLGGRDTASPDPDNAPVARTATPAMGVQRWAGAPGSSQLERPMLGAAHSTGRSVEPTTTAGEAFASVAVPATATSLAEPAQINAVHASGALRAPMLQRHVDGSLSLPSRPASAAGNIGTPLVAERAFELPADLTMVDHDGTTLGSFGEPAAAERPAVQRTTESPTAAASAPSSATATLQREEAPASQAATDEADDGQGEGSDEALVERIYDRVQWRLRRELLLDRERSGRLIDRRW